MKAKHKRSDLAAASSLGASALQSVHSGNSSLNAAESNVDIRATVKDVNGVNRGDLERKDEVRRSDRRPDRGADKSADKSTDKPERSVKAEPNEAQSADQHSTKNSTNVNNSIQRVKRTSDVHSDSSASDARRSANDVESESLHLNNQSAIYRHYLSAMSDTERPVNDFGTAPAKQLRSTSSFNKDKKHYYPNYYLEHGANFDGNPNGQPADLHAGNHFKNETSDLYVSKLNLDTKIYSFGFVECWAENEIGVQEEPCVFTVIPAGWLLKFERA